MLKQLKALRELPKPAEATLPINVLDLLKPVAAQIYADGARVEEGQNRKHTERMHRLLGDLEAEVDTLASINQALEGRVASVTRQQAEAEVAAADARATITRQADEINALKAALGRRPDESANQIAGLLVKDLAMSALSQPLTGEAALR